jgi:two-component SAPR family response regulator
MPEINGLELTKKVAELDSEIEVMLMSAYELDADKLKEVNKGRLFEETFAYWPVN